MSDIELWEWLDLGDRSRIYRFGEIQAGGGFIIGGLKPSQAKRIVEFHNEAMTGFQRAHTAEGGAG